MQRPRADLNQVPSWRDALLRRLAEAKHYPSRARRLRQEGVSYLRFETNMEGRVLAASITRGSGYELLDRETLALIHRIEPLPRPPKELAGQRLEFVVPVEFFLSNSR
ncbi:TonB family protein [Alcanivorax sp. 521-1]|uniref:TonB family protein n=1 Tax=Alloalcanivorax profundimaris TaxID=2735259 RepID=A0ABS0ANZ2_9GAMM|nr:TonB family protein [Alloalcanivorax profundimaris]MBF5055206.1 TonB family protein [Alloalcanivorax profundimaris]